MCIVGFSLLRTELYQATFQHLECSGDLGSMFRLNGAIARFIIVFLFTECVH